ncbi:MAG: ABC transporter permease subunit [Desulfobacterales bacterium]|jgi:tungstate transport system permease protein|nr:ABC transporter permease subunit [Desulfobacterales bacterium]
MDFIQEGFFQAVALLRNRDPATYSAISVTLRASGMAMVVSLLLGLPLGYLLGYFDFRFKKQIRIVVDTLLSLPTVFIGLVVYALLTRNGPLGETGLLFTIPGIAVGQAILALPIVIALTATAVEASDRNLRITLMSLGANRFQIAKSTLWEVRLGLLAAAVTATGRVLTEVGISLMVGGNIKWHTRTITTAIALETSKGEFGMGIALGLVLLLIALTVNISLAGLRRRI